MTSHDVTNVVKVIPSMLESKNNTFKQTFDAIKLKIDMDTLNDVVFDVNVLCSLTLVNDNLVR